MVDVEIKDDANQEVQLDKQESKNNEQSNQIKGKNKKKIIIFLVVSIALIVTTVIAFLYFFQIPVVNINGKIEENVEVGEVYIDKGINAYTKFRNIGDKVVIEGNVDTSKLGQYTIKYKVPHLTGYKEYTRTVNVIDKKEPVITLDNDEEYILSYGSEYAEPGYHAYDNYDGDITDKVEIRKIEKDEENYDIKYTVKDSSNNEAKIIRHVKIIDNEAPVITLNGNNIVSIIVGNPYNESGANAIDNKDGDISSKIKISGTVDTSKEGVYTIKYTVQDTKGNSAEEHRKVIVNTVEKAGIIYLTIDDGPSTTITPQILDILKEKGVHATFFVINYSDATEELVKRELNEGNAVGIHGYSHNYEEIYSSADACYENIIKLQQKIYNSTGRTVKIVRFPGGSSNTVSKNYCEGVMTEISQRILNEGYKYYDWNVDSCDAGGARNKDAVFNNVISNLKHGRSNVVLMHDFSGNTKTLEALPDIIDYGLENGYVFDIITDETPMVTHSILN